MTPEIPAAAGVGRGWTAGATADSYRLLLRPRRRHPDHPERLGKKLRALRPAGAADVILYPTSEGLEQGGLLAEAPRSTRFLPARNHGREGS